MLAIEIEILTSIDDVKPRGPKQYRQSEQHGCPIKLTFDGDPRTDRRN